MTASCEQCGSDWAVSRSIVDDRALCPRCYARSADNGASAVDADDVRALLVDMREAMRTAEDPIPYLVEPIAVQGLVTVLVGRHSSMKSWLMITAAAAVQRGGDEVAGYRVAQGPVLYIDAEMGPRLMARRFQAGGLEHDAFHVADGFVLRLPDSKDRIAALIQATGARLVVMDSLRRLAPGAREDRSDDMSPIMAALAELSRALDVAIVLIHHRSTKQGAAETRGSSAIEDQADIVFAFEHVDDDGDRERRRLRTVKFRPDEEPAASWVRLGRQGSHFTIAGAEPFEGADEPVPLHEQLVVRAAGLVGAIAKDGGWTPASLAEALGIDAGSGTYWRVWKGLEAQGWKASGHAQSRRLHPPGTSPYEVSLSADLPKRGGGERDPGEAENPPRSAIFDRDREFGARDRASRTSPGVGSATAPAPGAS